MFVPLCNETQHVVESTPYNALLITESCNLLRLSFSPLRCSEMDVSYREAAAIVHQHRFQIVQQLAYIL